MIDAPTITPPVLKALIDEVHKHTGITMSERKRLLLQGRLRKRLRACGLTSYHGYLSLLKSDPSEIKNFIDEVTTNKTSFFRTPRVWKFLWKEYLPAWAKAGSRHPLRIWSAACSSGEEPYSMALLCQESTNRRRAFSWRMVATDISERMVQTSANGCFPTQRIKSAAGPVMLPMSNYFKFTPDGQAEANVELKANITFKRHNLFAPFRANEFDLVLLRNVLIYFCDADKAKVIDNVARSLKPGGTLIVGEHESLLNHSDQLEYLQCSIYGKKR